MDEQLNFVSCPSKSDTGELSATVAKEVRLAVVMYGGVSLAIYMNGIAQELWRLVRSTARTSNTDGQFRFNPAVSTEDVYREVARTLNGTPDDDVRFIIDIISGTSAGGINGIFLAKALSDDSLSLEGLESLWINKGAIESLLNDRRTAREAKLKMTSPPQALLSGDRMYRELLNAFDGMRAPFQNSGARAAGSGEPRPLCGHIELAVTTTDIFGRVVPLRLADRLVYERRFKVVFQLRRDDSRNDFKEEANPYLAFAARCTSSFPFAFEPMQFKKIAELTNKTANAKEPGWIKAFFESQDGELLTDKDTRPFGDGGYLDNKPFSYAIDVLGHNSSGIPAERKLIYIEPSPEHPELDQDPRKVPNAVQNAYAALVKLPGYETIREDLERLNGRNRLVRKVIELTDEITSKLISSKNLQLRETRVGDFSYVVLRAYTTTDDLARSVACWFGHWDDDFFYALRCLIRAWRERKYEGSGSAINSELFNSYRKFLNDCDLSYWFRTCSFLRQKIDLLYCADEQAKKHLRARSEKGDIDREAFRNELLLLRKPFDDAYVAALGAIRNIRNRRLNELSQDKPDELDQAISNLLKVLERYRTDQKCSAINYVLGLSGSQQQSNENNERKMPERSTKSIPKLPVPAIADENYIKRATEVLDFDGMLPAVQAVAKALCNIISEVRNNGKKQIEHSLKNAKENIGNDHSRRVAFNAVKDYYHRFELFDAAIFPIIYGTDVETPEMVSVIRISPEDATRILDESECSQSKLAGVSLGHFGAFLDRSFRINDILWGRLDGAERIIRALLPTDTTRANILIDQAHQIILTEFIAKSQSRFARFVNEFAHQLEEQERRQGISECVRQALQDPLAPALNQVAAATLTPTTMQQCLSECPTVREPNRRIMLESATRAIRIIGELVEGLDKRTQKAGSFIARLGGLLLLLAQAAVPGGLQGRFLRHIMGLLLAFETVMIVGGTFASQPAQTLGFKLLAITLAIWLIWDGFRRWLLVGRRALKMFFLFAILLSAGAVGTSIVLPGINSHLRPIRDKIGRYTHTSQPAGIEPMTR